MFVFEMVIAFFGVLAVVALEPHSRLVFEPVAVVKVDSPVVVQTDIRSPSVLFFQRCGESTGCETTQLY